jgi:ribosome-binding factor A
MSDEHRPTKIAEEIQHHAADFFAREANRNSLITITRAELSANQKNITVFFSVMPESEEQRALTFMRRKRNDFIIYLRRHTKIGILPKLEFEIDLGEKNRQRIDDLTRT